MKILRNSPFFNGIAGKQRSSVEKPGFLKYMKFIIIFCIPAFILTLRVNVSCKYAAFLRNASIVTYCLHDNLNYTIMRFTPFSPTPLETFFIVLVASWLLTALIMKMEKNEHLSWLKYSH